MYRMYQDRILRGLKTHYRALIFAFLLFSLPFSSFAQAVYSFPTEYVDLSKVNLTFGDASIAADC